MSFQKTLRVLSSLLLICTRQSAGNDPLNPSKDFLLCRHCGINIAPASTVINLRSPAAEGFDNQTLFGLDNVEVQSLRNPFGIQFNIVTSKGGTCIGVGNKWQVEHSWYPSYAWKSCQCTRCSKQIGWIFEPLATANNERVYASLKGFYAFILDNIISEAYADSLLITPKSYAFR